MRAKLPLARKKSNPLLGHCIPCEGGVPPLSRKESLMLLREITPWRLVKNKIQREWVFQDFQQSMRFVGKVAALAEKENHHPDIHIHWNKVKLESWTHAAQGLTQNDFILAHKINQLNP